MVYIRKILFFVATFSLFILVLIAAADNSDPVILRFLQWESLPWPISRWILLAFVVGFFLGAAFNFASNFRLRAAARQANRIASDRGAQLDEVRAEVSEVVKNAG
jgi:uncharacterized integral membrane protein